MRRKDSTFSQVCAWAVVAPYFVALLVTLLYGGYDVIAVRIGLYAALSAWMCFLVVSFESIRRGIPKNRVSLGDAVLGFGIALALVLLNHSPALPHLWPLVLVALGYGSCSVLVWNKLRPRQWSRHCELLASDTRQMNEKYLMVADALADTAQYFSALLRGKRD